MARDDFTEATKKLLALIDRDEKYFTVEMLKKWKEDAEREAGNRLIGQETIKKCKF